MSDQLWLTDETGTRRFLDFEARPGTEKGVNTWRLFHRGDFVFSAATGAEIRRFVRGWIERGVA